MTRQYKRKVQVIVGGGGEGLVIEDLRVDFDIKKTAKGEPNEATVLLYNLNPANEVKVKEEYAEIAVSAGYEGAVLTIFLGQIKFATVYQEGLDRITKITAGDGEKDYRQATMNITMAAGTSDVDVVEQALASFIGGTVEGPLISVSEKQRVRGKVITGSSRTILDKVANEAGGSWSIQDGELQIVPAIETLPDEAVLITSETGMIGAAEAEEDGVKVTCLMNPALKVNAKIMLDNTAIKEASVDAKTRASSVETEGPEDVRVSPDGIYKILELRHNGSTHALEWYTTATCVALA